MLSITMNFKRILGSSCVALALVGCNDGAKQESNQPEKMDQLVHDVVTKMLEKEPELFVAAIDRAVQNQQKQLALEIENAATQAQEQFWSSSLVMGNKEGKLRLAVFFDPLDPVSQKFRSEVIEPIVKARSDVGFFLVPVSIYGGVAREGEATGPSSVAAAQALIAASWQDSKKALTFWSKMPNINKEFPPTKMKQLAETCGLNIEQLDRDMKGNAAHQMLVANGQLAITIHIPLQLPVIFIRNNNNTMNMIPPFVQAKMINVLDDVLNGKPWDSTFIAQQGGGEKEPVKEVNKDQDAAKEAKAETAAPATPAAPAATTPAAPEAAPAAPVVPAPAADASVPKK